MSTNLKLDPDSLAHIVQKAVLDSITPEARDQLLTDAIKSLLTIPKDDRPTYQRHTPLQSPLQDAFETAVHFAARKIVNDAIENDPKVQAAIRAVVHPLVADLCEGNYQGLPEAIGSAFGKWLEDNKK